MPADGSGRSGGRRRPVLATIVAVLLVTGVGTALIHWSGSRSTAGLGHVAPSGAVHPGRVALPHPVTISSGGREYRVHQVPLLAVLPDQANARMLRVPVFEHADPQQPGCAELSTSVRLTQQTATSVTIAAFGYSAARYPRQRYCSFVTIESESLYAEHAVTLTRPLGARAVIDARTGKQFAVLTSDLVRTPTHVPAGFGLTRREGFTASSGFAALIQYAKGSRSVEIYARSGSPRRDGTIEGTATVKGHRATVYRQSYERCLTWTDEPGLGRDVCSLGAKPYLPATELVRIADSLH